MVFKKIIFQNRYVALETPSRPPFMAKAILNFNFDYLNPSLRLSVKRRESKIKELSDNEDEWWCRRGIGIWGTSTQGYWCLCIVHPRYGFVDKVYTVRWLVQAVAASTLRHSISYRTIIYLLNYIIYIYIIWYYIYTLCYH